jgi:hypothetical protein
LTKDTGPRRATVYFDPEIYRALKVKAASTNRTFSDLVNDAIRATLGHDHVDLTAFDEREEENTVSYEALLKDLKSRGKL